MPARLCREDAKLIRQAPLGCLRLVGLATDAAGELHVLRHDGHALGVDRAEVGVLEEARDVGLAGLLQCRDCVALDTQVLSIGFHLIDDLLDEPLERPLPDQKLGTLLVLADLAERDGAGAVAVGLLDAAGGGAKQRCGAWGGCGWGGWLMIYNVFAFKGQ